MRKLILFLLLAAALAGLAAVPCAAEEGKEPDEWTVMFYFCGSDLESKYSYATGNLEEISKVKYPFNLLDLFGMDPGSGGQNADDVRKVNILIETGGSKEWHAQDLEMDISTTSLQRWKYNYHPDDLTEENNYKSFTLMETLPLKSMGDPEQLSDFIRWTAKNYPAKKYALVLWDHGGGAKTGLFIDELFSGDVLYLYELKQALADGGIQMETIVIDACMMANIETAWAIKESAKWMVASEEVVPGRGTAIGDWLQALVNHPMLDGEWLGRCICDMTGAKYAKGTDEMAKSLLTWSVIDLNRIDPLIEQTGKLFTMMGKSLQGDPTLMRMYTSYIYEAEEYGDEQQNMRDLGAVIYNQDAVHFVGNHMIENLIEALSDAVVYIARGPGRSASRGLSFCYPANFSKDELNIYAKNFPMPHYLAYIDAITDWTAPDWVYEKTERLLGIDEIETLKITIEKRMAENGIPGLCFGQTEKSLDEVYYRLYREDEDTGELLRLGRTDCGQTMAEDGQVLWRPNDPMHWPAIDNVLCCIDLVQSSGMARLYNVPIQINSETSILRCGRTLRYTGDSDIPDSTYEIYGVWEGYDENVELMNRSVKPLAMLAGRRFNPLYPKDGMDEDGKTIYAIGGELTILRKMDMEEIRLPPGTYYLEYELGDMFMRSALLDRIRIYWDGEKITFPEGFTWEGTVEVKWEHQ